MKTNTIRCMLLVLFAVQSWGLQAQDVTYTVRIETPGTLSSQIPASEKYKISHLTVSGKLNGLDIDFIRDMAGVARALKPLKEYSYETVYAYEDSITEGKLAVLDLSKAEIMVGSSYLIHGSKVICENGNKYFREEYYQTKGDNWIGDYMFSGCISLTSVTIPDNLNSFGIEPFSGCLNMKSLIASDKNRKFSSQDGVLFNKSKTQLIACLASESSYKIPASVVSVAANAFAGCKGLVSVTIPGNVASIGTNAFKDCASLKEMIIEDGNNQLLMGDYSLKYGTVIDFIFPESPLEKVYVGRVLSNNDRECSPFAFFKKSIRQVTVGEGMNAIGSNAFLGCTSLISISIPASVKSIGSQAFYHCSSLTSVALPNRISYIGGNAFSDCSALTSIVIPDSVRCIRAGTFANCTSLMSLSIPDNVTSVIGNAFEGCTGVRSITIGDSLTWIMNDAFTGCTGLKEFIVSGGNPKYTVVDGVLFNKEKTQLFAYPNARSASYTIPEGVRFIADKAFSGCIKLNSITMPVSVRLIGTQSFYGCTGLTSVDIPNSVTTIGCKSFANSTGLTTVNIGSGVNSIYPDAFSGCRDLKEFIVSSGNAAYCSENGVLFTKDKKYLYAYPKAKSAIYTIPSYVTFIGEEAFSNCIGLKELHCSSIAPPRAYTSSFNGMDKALCKLYVPKGSRIFYNSADNWGFGNIIEE
ncbi:leucine-rich repeat domain-containing protein [Bacteroides sedimenti]